MHKTYYFTLGIQYNAFPYKIYRYGYTPRIIPFAPCPKHPWSSNSIHKRLAVGVGDGIVTQWGGHGGGGGGGYETHAADTSAMTYLYYNIAVVAEHESCAGGKYTVT